MSDTTAGDIFALPGARYGKDGKLVSNKDDGIAYIETKTLRKRQTIFREGDAGDCMYVVEAGRVGILAHYGEASEKLLTVIEPGGFFGEMGMVRGFPRSASAEAMESDTVVTVITWETLGRYFKDSPGKIVGIMQQMSRRIEELSNDYIDACGAVAELLGQRDALAKENKSLAKKLEHAQSQTGRPRMQGDDSQPDGMPVWEVIEGESEEEKDARFKKYIAAYQRYRRFSKI